jgi:hypothetical protein
LKIEEFGKFKQRLTYNLFLMPEKVQFTNAFLMKTLTILGVKNVKNALCGITIVFQDPIPLSEYFIILTTLLE